MRKTLGITVITLLVILCLDRVISNKQDLYISIGGTFIGFLGAFIIYQIGVIFDEKEKQKLRGKNTKYIYQLYKLKTITRNKLWGELADYSKDIELMKKISHAYGEFELINNKIDLTVASRMANIERSQAYKSNEIEQEKQQQLEGAIGLGKGVLPVIEECLDILNKTIEN